MLTPNTHSPACSVMTIGTFDGVHAGHRAVVARARELAKANPGPEPARVVALVFDPHPMTVLRPDRAPARLTTPAKRCELLLRAGVDEVVLVEPTPEVLAKSAEAFIAECVEAYRPIAVVEGSDFRFGKGRAAGIDELRRLGGEMGFGVEVVGDVEVSLTDHQYVPARSTIVRWLLENGRVRDAAIVLGRAYEIEGTVVRGDRRGRTIGYPTANLETECMIPADGVYAGRAELPDGRAMAAAVSIGTKPTFGVHERALEAFLLMPDAAGKSWSPIAGLPEYGWKLRLDLLGWVREQLRFDSLDGLLEQMGRDCERAAAMFAAGAEFAGETAGAEREAIA